MVKNITRTITTTKITFDSFKKREKTDNFDNGVSRSF